MNQSIKVNSFIGELNKIWIKDMLYALKSPLGKLLHLLICAATIASEAHAKPDRVDIPFRETPQGFCKEFTEYGAWKELLTIICYSNIKSAGENTITYDWNWYSPHAGHSELEEDDGIGKGGYKADCKNNKYGMLNADGSFLMGGSSLGSDEVKLCQYALKKGLIAESIERSIAYVHKPSSSFQSDDGACVKGQYEILTTYDLNSGIEFKRNEAILCYFDVELIDDSLIYLVETRSYYRPYRKNRWIKDEFASELVVDCEMGTYTTGRNIVEEVDEWWKFDSIREYGYTRPFFEEFCEVINSDVKSDAQLSNTQPRSSLPAAEAPALAATEDRSKPELYQTLDNTPFYWRIK